MFDKKQKLVFKKYHNLKIGFSTFSFQKVLPLNASGLTELIKYASIKGFNFIEIRDPFVELSETVCKMLAEVAIKCDIGILYVFNKNLLDSGFSVSFVKALNNVRLFPGPGILRALVSKSEFETDPKKIGWTKEELAQLVKISDDSAKIAKSKNIQFVVENGVEAFFGDNISYFGLADFISDTNETGLQFDIANLYHNINRAQNDPDKILQFLPAIGNRWIETHLKTIQDGQPQPYLTANPLPVESIVELMGKQNVQYLTLELAPADEKELCFENIDLSLQFLKDRGILKV